MPVQSADLQITFSFGFLKNLIGLRTYKPFSQELRTGLKRFLYLAAYKL